VVIVGGMGSIPGAAIGALIIGLAEQIGLVYAPTYSVVFTFLIMAVVLAFRPQGLWGRAVDGHGADRSTPPAAASEPDAGSSASPGWWALAFVLLIMPAFANNFWLFQVFGWTFILGHDRAQPDVPRRLWRHGQPDPDDGRGAGRLHGRDPRHLGRDQISLGLPWWLYIPVAILIAAPSPRWSARSRCGPRASTRS
jgi:hypothetical protein